MDFIYLILSSLFFMFLLSLLIFIYYSLIKNTINSVFPIVDFLLYENGVFNIKKARTDGQIIINNSIFNILLGNFKILGFDLDKYETIYINNNKYYKAILINDFFSPFYNSSVIFPFSLHINRYTSMLRTSIKYQNLSNDKNEELLRYLPVFIMFIIFGILLFFGIGHIEELKQKNMIYNIDVMNEIIRQTNDYGLNYSEIKINYNETNKTINNETDLFNSVIYEVG